MSPYYVGLLASGLSVLAYLPYIVDTAVGRTQPQRASWLIWSILATIAFFSQVYEGATTSLYFAGAQLGATVAVFLLSLRRGAGTDFKPFDFIALSAAAVGLSIWYVTDTAAYALAITITVSLIGGTLTATKAYADPDSETLSTWVIGLISSIFAILAVGVFDPVLLAYPLYLFTLFVIFIGAIILGRAREGASVAT